ncbi:hypothetical protein ASD15_27275 [Massilia sp. Root351]|uniref:hypothetical protein n=1 Tax=Massilia sp. Root351 TaxID=1736522 RepID=UPI00070F31EF|nr:hypothetical protein [Massilia sp. Root351]KQV87764.1 hypothetical protein ASD15_27275 [Massilia sp. Root351]
MAMSRLSITITAPIALISALAIGLTVFLNVGKLDRTLGELEDSRLRFTINVLRQNLETGLDLGLPVRSLGNAQAAMELEARQDPDIVALIVKDDKGRAAFSTGRPAQSDSIVLSTPLSNNLGVTVGAIELHYSRRSHDRFIAGISRQLLLAGLLATVLSTLLAVLGTQLWVRRIGRTLGSIEHTLDASAPPVARPDRHAVALAEQAAGSAGRALRDLEQARRAITSKDVAGEKL